MSLKKILNNYSIQELTYYGKKIVANDIEDFTIKNALTEIFDTIEKKANDYAQSECKNCLDNRDCDMPCDKISSESCTVEAVQADTGKRSREAQQDQFPATQLKSG